MATQIQLRRDTAANWVSVNPILAQGEPGVEIDTGKDKIGDGVSAWNSLAYSAAGNASTVTTNANLTGDVTSIGNATAIAAGVIVNADINASAAIADTKLATIATALKVSNSATTATDANTASAIVARDGSGNFTAGTITAAVTGAASSNVLKAGDTMTGSLRMDNQADLRFGEATVNGTNFVSLRAPASVAADITWTLPNEDAAVSGFALVSNAAGVLSWAAAGGGGGNGIIAENSQIISENYTLSAFSNGHSVGDVAVAATYLVTVPSGATWVIA